MQHHILQIDFQGMRLEIPYIVIKGGKEGTHIFISGGMHGNEINGIAAVGDFIKYAEDNDLKEKISGTITIIPVLNPSGFSQMTREVKEDNLDPNRAFGKTEITTFSEAMATELEKLLKDCDIGIDLHDAGSNTVLLPHSRVMQHEEDGCTKKMGQLFGTNIIIEREGHPHMMAVAMYQRHKVPVLTVEIGGGQTILPEFQAQALQGILNILSAYEIYQTEIKVPEEQFFLHNRFGVETNEPAEIRIDVKLGDYIHEEDEIGEIYYPITQKREKLVSPMCGYLFALWQDNQIPAHQTIYSILESKQCHVRRTTLKNFEKLSKFQVKKFNFSK